MIIIIALATVQHKEYSPIMKQLAILSVTSIN